jgi:hypothetical protein
MEKRFYFQNGLRAETEKKIKEEGPSYLQEVIEIASNFEFAHYTGKPVKSSIAAVSAANPKAKTPVQKQQGSSNKSAKKINSSQDWKKNAICHSCQKKGHIAPECPNRPKKEANHYVSGSFYAILEVQAEAFSNEANRQEVSIFIDNGCSLNGISEELAIQLRLTVCEDTNSLMEVDLGFGQTVLRPRRTASMNLQIPGFPVTRGAFQVMPIPEGKDIILGMMWLREHNPIINWETLELSPREREPQSDTMPLVLPTKRPARKIGGQRFARVNQSREIFNYYRQHGHSGMFGETKLISSKQFLRHLRKEKDIEAIFIINPHDSEKAERFKSQGWESLTSNPAYDILRKYDQPVFRTELPSSTPPVREGIEHEIQLKPGTQPISVKQWRQSPDQRQVIMDWTKEMVKVGIIRPSTSAFSAPTICVKKPVGWRIVHDYRQLNQATVMPAIPMPRKEDTFDSMAGSYWYSCMDLLWGYYQVKLREQDIPFTAFSTPDGLFEYLVTPMGLSGSPGTFNRLLHKVFSDLRDVMRIHFDDIYVFTESVDVNEHVQALDRVLERCEEQELYIKLSKC